LVIAWIHVFISYTSSAGYWVGHGNSKWHPDGFHLRHVTGECNASTWRFIQGCRLAYLPCVYHGLQRRSNCRSGRYEVCDSCSFLERELTNCVVRELHVRKSFCLENTSFLIFVQWHPTEPEWTFFMCVSGLREIESN
jgi:hypothetical protein